MPRDHCPPSRRGHSWSKQPLVVSSDDGSTTVELVALRKCSRCGTLGRVSSQGIIHVVELP